MKKYLVPVGAGVVVFGAVTAFAASLSVNTTSLASGNATVGSCNSSASVTYNTTGTTGTKTYKVTTAPITSAAACGTMAYKVSLLGAGNATLAEKTGTLDSTGADAPDFTSSNVSAQDVIGVAVVITG